MVLFSRFLMVCLLLSLSHALASDLHWWDADDVNFQVEGTRLDANLVEIKPLRLKRFSPVQPTPQVRARFETLMKNSEFQACLLQGHCGKLIARHGARNGRKEHLQMNDAGTLLANLEAHIKAAQTHYRAPMTDMWWFVMDGDVPCGLASIGRLHPEDGASDDKKGWLEVSLAIAKSSLPEENKARIALMDFLKVKKYFASHFPQAPKICTSVSAGDSAAAAGWQGAGFTGSSPWKRPWGRVKAFFGMRSAIQMTCALPEPIPLKQIALAAEAEPKAKKKVRVKVRRARWEPVSPRPQPAQEDPDDIEDTPTEEVDTAVG